MSATGSPPARAETAWYVYGVVPADTSAALLAGASGLGVRSVRLIAEGALAAIVSEVPLAEFGDEPLAVNLHDPVWLEAGVRRHDAVLASVVRETAVVPFRFGTIYRGEEHVRAMLAEHPALADALEALRGRIELGVKGIAREAPVPSTGDEGDVPAGRRYLEQKQRERRAAEEREATLARAADESHGRLSAVAEDARANPLQPPQASGDAGTMFLNGAYLVRVAGEREFRDTVESLRAELGPERISFELTGPWPPYNFVEVVA